MIKLVSALTFALLFAATIQTEADPVQDFITNPPRASDVAKRLIATHHQKVITPDDAKRLKSRFVKPDPLARVEANYAKAQRDHRIGLGILKANNLLIRSTLYVGLSAAGPAGLVTRNIVDWIAKEGLGALEEKAAQALKHNSRRVLETGLALYRRDHGIDTLKDLNPKKIVKLLNEKGYLPKQDFGTKFDEEGRIIAAEAKIKELANFDLLILNKLADEGAKIGNLSEIQIAHAKRIRDLQGLSIALWQTTQNNSARIDRINKNMNAIQKDLEYVKSQVGRNSNDILRNRSDIEYLQESMFGRMSPQEQLAALERGFFRGMDPEKRTNLKRRIEIVARRVELANDIAAYAGHAAEVYNIAQNLGVSGDVLKLLGTSSQLGAIAGQAAGAWASGDVVGMASALSNVLGLGKPNPEATRHRQIVNLLGKVLDNQQQMLQSLGRIEARQIQIIRIQKATYEAILQLSDEVRKQYRSLLTQLELVKYEIRINRSGIRDLLIRDILRCDSVTGGRHAFGYPIDYNVAISQYSILPEDHDACMNGVMNVVPGVGISDSAFRADWWLLEDKVDSYAFTEDRSARFLEKIWKPLQKYYTRLLSYKNISIQNVFSSALMPAPTVAKLDAKWSVVRKNSPLLVERWKRWQRRDSGGLTSLSEALGRYYNPAATSWILNHLQRFGAMKELRDPADANGRRVLPPEITAERGWAPSGEVRERFNSALLRSDILVAQQAMLSGEALLPMFYEIAFSDDTSDDYAGFSSGLNETYRKGLYDLLNANQLLAENFMMYAVNRETQATGTGGFWYHFVVNSPKGRRRDLSAILAHKERWKLEWFDVENPPEDVRPAGTAWCARFGKTCLGFPKAAELHAGRMIYRARLTDALKLQAAMINQVLSYEMFDPTVTKLQEDREALAGTILIK